MRFFQNEMIHAERIVFAVIHIEFDTRQTMGVLLIFIQLNLLIFFSSKMIIRKKSFDLIKRFVTVYLIERFFELFAYRNASFILPPAYGRYETSGIRSQQLYWIS